AIESFFPLVVPQKKRDNHSLDILLDMQTQQWLTAADDERQLQTTVKQVRGMDDGAIAQLLAINSEAAAALSEDGAGGPASGFESLAISEYRQIVGRRLNKISGGKLHIARSQYTLAGLQKRIAQFVYECAKMLSPPVILARQTACNDADDASFAVDDVREDTVEQEEAPRGPKEQEQPGTGSAEPAGEVEGSVVSGDFEVTIYQDKDEIERLRNQIRDSVESFNSAGTVASGAADGAQSGANANNSVIDSSFVEERRIATFIRDSISDEHLDILIDAITSNPTDIQTMQQQIIGRLFTDLDGNVVAEPGVEAGSSLKSVESGQGSDDGFRLDLGDTSVPAAGDGNG
ncbi:hypothetical protein LPJ75_007026, partial [Coemansia sp. RSA 2598]